MKLAITFHHMSQGGGSRFFKCLVLALIKEYRDLKINIFILPKILKDKDFIDFFVKQKNITIVPLYERKTFNYFWIKYLKKLPIGNFLVTGMKQLGFGVSVVLSKKTIAEINKNDLLYLPWPFYLSPCNFKIPVFGTFHDFNYKHSFGRLGKVVTYILDKQTKFWLNKSPCPIVSSEFIKSEIDKWYPFASSKTKVIHVSTFVFNEEESIRHLDWFLQRIDLPSRYVLYPSNTALHKNHSKLFDAFGFLKKNKIQLPLVLAGGGTNFIAKYYYKKEFSLKYFRFKNFIKSLKKNELILGKDIFILGYVSDEQIYALIKKAALVISPTLYEAGSGPGLDAWYIGTPIAFSNIASHLNQMDFLKTEAWVFDPQNPINIAKIIQKALLFEKNKSIKMTQKSKENIQKYTWNNIAQQYYNVFQNKYLKV